MKINISPAKTNTYPKKGILIKGKSPNDWLLNLQLLAIDLIQTTVYPIPSAIANELYGCFVIIDTPNTPYRQLNVYTFQSVNDYLYIPEFSKISPLFSKEEAQTVFKSPHIYHPDFGWVILNQPIQWQQILKIEKTVQTTIIQPAKTVYTPKTIKSYQLNSKKEVDVIKELGLTVAPLKKDQLSNFEQVKLKLFQTLYSSKKNNKGGFDIEGKGLLKWLNNNSTSKNTNSNSKLKKDFEKLLFRNQKETDKLLSLFKSNPNLALSKAIPLDLLGTSRGTGQGVLSIFNTNDSNTKSNPIAILISCIGLICLISFLYGISGGSFSAGRILGVILVSIIFALLLNSSNNQNPNNDSINLDRERMNALRKEYEKLADQAIKNKQYKKAASIYIKLLKDNYKAASTLEEGKFYEEAAVIHLKYNNNKQSAAQAYENGKFYDKAINLYKELKQNEKVGDLYKSINNQIEANKHFQIVIDNYLEQSQYVKASLIYKYKIEDTTKAQEPLLRGWRENKDQYNCLNNYFGNFKDGKKLQKGIHNVYKEETNSTNISTFLKALKQEYTKHKNLQDYTKSLAYEAVAKYIEHNPSIAYSLSSFNADNSLLNSDTSKFVKQEKKRKRNNG